MKTDIRWSTPSDFRNANMEEGVTRRGMTLEIDGEIAAVVSMNRTGVGTPPIVCTYATDDARRHPKAFHAFVVRAIKEAANLGAISLLAVADRSIPRSDAWLERLGFHAVGEIEEGVLYRCKLSR